MPPPLPFPPPPSVNAAAIEPEYTHAARARARVRQRQRMHPGAMPATPAAALGGQVSSLPPSPPDVAPKTHRSADHAPNARGGFTLSPGSVGQASIAQAGSPPASISPTGSQPSRLRRRFAVKAPPQRATHDTQLHQIAQPLTERNSDEAKVDTSRRQHAPCAAQHSKQCIDWSGACGFPLETVSPPPSRVPGSRRSAAGCMSAQRPEPSQLTATAARSQAKGGLPSAKPHVLAGRTAQPDAPTDSATKRGRAAAAIASAGLASKQPDFSAPGRKRVPARTVFTLAGPGHVSRAIEKLHSQAPACAAAPIGTAKHMDVPLAPAEGSPCNAPPTETTSAAARAFAHLDIVSAAAAVDDGCKERELVTRTASPAGAQGSNLTDAAPEAVIVQKLNAAADADLGQQRAVPEPLCKQYRGHTFGTAPGAAAPAPAVARGSVAMSAMEAEALDQARLPPRAPERPGSPRRLTRAQASAKHGDSARAEAASSAEASTVQAGCATPLTRAASSEAMAIDTPPQACPSPAPEPVLRCSARRESNSRAIREPDVVLLSAEAPAKRARWRPASSALPDLKALAGAAAVALGVEASPSATRLDTPSVSCAPAGATKPERVKNIWRPYKCADGFADNRTYITAHDMAKPQCLLLSAPSCVACCMTCAAWSTCANIHLTAIS